MKMVKRLSYVFIAALLVFCGTNAAATSLGNDVTLYDNVSGGGWGSGGADPRVDVLGDATREDNEGEPGAASGQEWDLEGTYYDYGSHTLSIAGGYDYVNGVLFNGYTYRGGDIFLAVSPTLGSGPGQIEAPNTNGSDYDYVIDIDYAALTYNIYSLPANATTTNGMLQATNIITASNPWRYNQGGTLVTSGAFTVGSYATQAAFAAALGATGGEYTPVAFGGNDDHYIMSGFDLSWLYSTLNPGDFIYTHYTMECGNDLITGLIPVPEPSTYALMAMGLAALVARRKFLKSAKQH